MQFRLAGLRPPRHAGDLTFLKGRLSWRRLLSVPPLAAQRGLGVKPWRPTPPHGECALGRGIGWPASVIDTRVSLAQIGEADACR
jgi:hypothetical protein